MALFNESRISFIQYEGVLEFCELNTFDTSNCTLKMVKMATFIYVFLQQNIQNN